MSEFAAVISLGSIGGKTGFRIDGEDPTGDSGFSVSSAGDVNGDGIDDVIIGAVGATSGAQIAGSSYVVFGKAGGSRPDFDLSELNGRNGFQLDGTNFRDLSGWSVSSAGDVNGDGFDDVIVGARGADPNGEYSGSSYVVFGKAGGFAPKIALASLDGTTGFRLDGNEGDRAGTSVSSAGDVNGDGFDDFIIGAYGADPSGLSSGSSYVVFGKAGGFAAGADLSSIDGTNGFRLDGVADRDRSGWSVSSAGDVNGDGFDDVIVGAIGADPSGPSSGSSYVVFGKSGGFAASINLSSLDGTNGFRLDGVADYDGSGRPVSSAGDVNGDGFDDFVIGAYNADPSGRSSGSSYVVFGKAGGFAPSVDLSSLDGTNGFRLDGAKRDGYSGRSVSSAGDVNGDGFDDLIIGTPGDAPNGRLSGSSYVVFGKAGSFAVSIDLSSIDGTNGFRLDGVAKYDESGWSVSEAGDVNRDGFDDLIVGAPSASSGAGSSYVVYGRAPDEAVTRTGAAGDNTISGGTFADTLNGLGGDDTLNGNEGEDILEGGGGGDALNGGTGFDTASYRNAGGGVSASLASPGLNTGEALGDVFDSIENLRGSAFADALSGDANRNVLEGGAGADRIIGVRAGDVASYEHSSAGVTVDLRLFRQVGAGDADGDVLENIQNVRGSAFADILSGDATINVLEGGAGADRITGAGIGDIASYAHSSVGVRVDLTLVTQVGPGDANGDVLRNIDNLRGSRLDDRLTGDDQANVLDGGRGADTLAGGAGNDQYIVDDAGDRVIEADRSGVRDTVLASVDHALGDFVERIKVLGSIDGLSLTGNDLDNYLIGGSGDETLTGGDGDDRYYVTSGDVVVEAADGGTDRVFASEDYALSGNVEQLRAAAGAVGLRLAGDGDDNFIVGGAGDDTLSGAGGRDQLKGGAGDDVFRFAALSDSRTGRADVIRDFVSGADLIDLSNLDAVAGGADDPFDFIGSDAFSGEAGELRYEAAGGYTRIEADVDGDGKANFRFVIERDVTLGEADFLL